MDLTWDYPQPYQVQVNVTEADIDELGHTNNTVYTRWCEQAAWSHSDSLGLNARDYQHLQRAMAIQRASYEYLAPSFVGDRVIVGTWLTACDGRLMMERSFQIYNEVTKQCLFRGRWHLICINLSNNKPARIPDEFKTAYLPHVIDGEIGG